jgi:hypothetical protein
MMIKNRGRGGGGMKWKQASVAGNQEGVQTGLPNDKLQVHSRDSRNIQCAPVLYVCVYVCVVYMCACSSVCDHLYVCLHHAERIASFKAASSMQGSEGSPVVVGEATQVTHGATTGLGKTEGSI